MLLKFKIRLVVDEDVAGVELVMLRGGVELDTVRFGFHEPDELVAWVAALDEQDELVWSAR